MHASIYILYTATNHNIISWPENAPDCDEYIGGEEWGDICFSPLAQAVLPTSPPPAPLIPAGGGRCSL